MLATEINPDGAIHGCNGYFLVQELEEENRHGLIVVADERFRSAIIVEMSPDFTNMDLDLDETKWEWRIGDLIYFSDSLEAGGHMFVHWTDIVAFRRIQDEHPDV